MRTAFIYILISMVAVLAALGTIHLIVREKTYSAQILQAFAQCVAKTGITMYGASWCPHCKAEKARYGESFKYISYVECPDNQQLCLDKGVTGYPTWIFPDGRKFIGEQGLERMASTTGCTL